MAWIGVYRALSDTCMTIGFYKNIFYTENDKIMISNDVFIFITRLLMVCDGKTECRHQVVAQLDGLVEHLTRENSGGSSSNPGHHFSNPIIFGALMTNPWNWQDDSCQGKEPKQWMCDLQGSRSFESGGMWRSDWFDDLCQIAQLVAHLTTKNSEGGGSNPGLVHHYFSHLVIGQCRGLCNS